MRIAFDAKRAYHNQRGLGNYSRDVIRLMTTYAPENEYMLMAQPSVRYSFPHTLTIAPQGLWHYMPSLWRSYGCTRSLKKADVYWGLSGELPLGIHRTGVRTVVTIHDTIFLRYPELYSATYRWLFTQKMAYALRVADVVVAISEQTKRDIITFFGADETKIKVVYQGCNNRFREPITDEQVAVVKKRYDLPDRYIVDVGALEPRKNLQTLIRAMAWAHIDLPLVAVGGKSRYGDEAAALAEKMGVKLLFLHALPFDELPMVYKGAVCSVYPSVFEGFGIPILESLCVGTPVLTSTGSCFSETGGEAALYADPLSPEDIGAQLARILTDVSLREEMIKKGHQQAALFTDEQVARHLIDICQLKV